MYKENSRHQPHNYKGSQHRYLSGESWSAESVFESAVNGKHTFHGQHDLICGILNVCNPWARFECNCFFFLSVRPAFIF